MDVSFWLSDAQMARDLALLPALAWGRASRRLTLPQRHRANVICTALPVRTRRSIIASSGEATLASTTASSSVWRGPPADPIA